MPVIAETPQLGIYKSIKELPTKVPGIAGTGEDYRELGGIPMKKKYGPQKGDIDLFETKNAGGHHSYPVYDVYESRLE